MEFRILGPLEVVDDGKPLRLDRRLSRALLAYLLLHANEPVSAGRLVDELWGADAPRTASASLQNYVSRLRKTLGTERLRLEPAGYVLRVDPERFDLTRFERLVEEAHTSPAKERAELLRAALSLWRGEPLEDLAFEEFAQGEIAHLAERRLTAIEERIEAELELGRGAELVDELEALIASHPLRERLRGQLMLALYRADRQADALDAYRAARRALRDELGLEPGEELRALEQAILRQDAALVTEPSTREAPESRRTLTILFCDVVDSTRLATALDPEAYRRLMSIYFDAVRTAVEAHGGTVEKFIGDAVLALFGVPELHEDDALRAVRAAVDVRDALAKVSDEAVREWGVRIVARIAVNTGEVLTSAGREARATGAAVNVAAHLEKRAPANEIVLGEETRALVRDAVRAERVELGDGLRAWRLDELIGDADGVLRRFDVPLVGRKRELRKLRTAFQRARKERSCVVVTIVGEAGIGKTRLAREFVASVQPEARVLVGRCVSYGAGATYLPVADIVRQAVPEASVAGIASLLAGEDDAQEVAERIAETVGVAEGPTAPGEAFRAVRRLFEGLARRQPLVLVFDDLHWAEPTLLDLVEYLGEWADAPIAVICLARRELLESRPEWGGPTSTGFVVELEPLRAEDVVALVGELAGASVAPDLEERIAERSGGNPLFAEQLLALASEVPDLPVDQAPPTVEALIASRLDRLAPGELDVLRRAAVIGRRFTRTELDDLAPGSDAELRRLERRGHVHPTDAKGGFRFHHVLVRDVAYRGIPKAERAELHERVANNLDRRNGEDEIVGYHFEQAYTYRAELARVDEHASELAAAAGNCLGRAGIRAWKRGDASAAVNLLGRATTLLREEDDVQRELLFEFALAAWTAGDPGGATTILERALQAATNVHDRRAELRARIELANVRLFTDQKGKPEDLLSAVETAIPVFESLGDDRSLGRAWLVASFVHGGLHSQYRASQDAAERAAGYARRAGWTPTASLQQIAAALYCGPTPVSEAIVRCEVLLTDVDRGAQANIQAFLAGFHAMRGDFDRARALAETARSTYQEFGWSIQLHTNLAPVVSEVERWAGNHGSAEEVISESCEYLVAARDDVHLSTQAAHLADLLLMRGQCEEALQWTYVAESRALPGDISAQYSWRAARAGALARSGRADEGERLAREATQLVKPTDALNEQGKALLRLADVLRINGRVEAASRYVEEALTAFERKENVVASAEARALLRSLVPA